MSKCKHKTTRPMWGRDWNSPSTYRCVECYAVGVRGIGPANDATAPIGEIVAAEIGQSPEVWTRWLNCDREIDRALDDMGVRGTFGLGASNSAGSHLDPQPPVQWTSRDIGDYLTGWLALRMAESHLEKDGGWPWDISRPIAEQFPVAEPTVEAAAEMFGDQISAGITDLLDTPRWPAADETQETRRIGAAEYEQARAAEPDIRDEDEHVEADVPPGYWGRIRDAIARAPAIKDADLPIDDDDALYVSLDEAQRSDVDKLARGESTGGVEIVLPDEVAR